MCVFLCGSLSICCNIASMIGTHTHTHIWLHTNQHFISLKAIIELIRFGQICLQLPACFLPLPRRCQRRLVHFSFILSYFLSGGITCDRLNSTANDIPMRPQSRNIQLQTTFAHTQIDASYQDNFRSYIRVRVCVCV